MKPSHPHSGTIYVVGDLPQILRAVTSSLERRGYGVRAIPELEQAQAIIEQQRPDLVIIDTGAAAKAAAQAYRLCRRLKGDGETPINTIPVILLVSAEPDAGWAGFEAGADDFLVKPLRQDELLSRVTVVLRARAQRDNLWRQNQMLTAKLAERNTELERALYQARELTIIKDAIVRNVSHELRTPLLQIKSAVSMLAEDARSAKPFDKKLVQYATQATTRLESVVQNITQLAASINVKIERFQVTDAIQTAMRHLERQWESSENAARIRIQAEDLPLVKGDRTAVGRVLQLLLDNALKFSLGGTPVELIAQRAQNGVWIAVRDYGIGIAEDQVGQVFQAFYQVDSSPTRRVGGAGVGLSLVKLVLDAMGIAIEVQSQLGVGSTFSFLLPIAEPEEVPTHLHVPQEQIVQSAKS